MLFDLLVFFIASNLLVAFLKKKSNILIWCSIIFIVFVFVGSRGVADLHNYTYDYIHGYEFFWKGGQFLFHFITETCHKLGLSFDAYRLFLSVLGLFFYYYFIKKFSPVPNLVMAAYMSYLMIMDDVQIRNFLGCAVFCLGLVCMFEQNRNWKKQYVFWIVVASTIHSSFWVYLIFLLIPNDLNKDKKIIIFGFWSILFSVLFLFVREYLNNLVMIFAFIDETKTEHYLLETTHFGGALFGIIQIFAIICIFYIKNKLWRKDGKQEAYRIIQIGFLIDILSLALVPAAIFSITFYRLLRNLFFVNAIVFSIGFYRLKNRILAFLMLIVYTGLFYYFDLTPDIYVEEILVPFLNKNIYF